jgi:hypothetical protein
LPADATVSTSHLRGQELVLLLEVVGRILDIEICEIVGLDRSMGIRRFPGEELLLIQMSGVDFSRFRCWAL